MPRKLKTYVTSVGFFDQAIAAPSMKAALEAWGANKDTFHRGFAEESDDPAIVKATMAKPGVVLKRVVGSNDPFTENPDLPKSLPAKAPARAKPAPKPKPKAKADKTPKGKPAEVVSLADARAAKQAAAEFEKEKARSEKEEAKENAAREKERARRDQAVGRAEAMLEKAKKRHDELAAAIARERAALERRETEEDKRWDKEKRKFEAALRKIGE